MPTRSPNAHAAVFENVTYLRPRSLEAQAAVFENVVSLTDPSTVKVWDPDALVWQKARYYEYDSATNTWKHALSAPDGDVDTWRGDWAAGTYEARSIVRHSGTIYRATVQTMGEPGVSADWTVA